MHAGDNGPTSFASGESPILLALAGNETCASDLAARLGVELGRVIVRRFPDDETYVRVESDLTGRPVALVCALDRPDTKTVPLLLLAAAARDLGAHRVGLVAPYLAYLRQDARFQPGEGMTSAYFAALLSGAFDSLVTVDPHLHRHRSLDELYAIPTVTVHAAPAIGRWILANVERPFVIGPDVESAQWVEAVATEAGIPWLVLEKTRRGDRDVEVSIPDMDRFKDRTPVLVDDIVSTAQTMIAAVGHLRRAAQHAPRVRGCARGLRRRGVREAACQRCRTGRDVRYGGTRVQRDRCRRASGAWRCACVGEDGEGLRWLRHRPCVSSAAPAP